MANYGGGSIAVLPIRGDGALGDAVDVHRDPGDPWGARMLRMRLPAASPSAGTMLLTLT